MRKHLQTCMKFNSVENCANSIIIYELVFLLPELRWVVYIYIYIYIYVYGKLQSLGLEGQPLELKENLWIQKLRKNLWLMSNILFVSVSKICGTFYPSLRRC